MGDLQPQNQEVVEYEKMSADDRSRVQDIATQINIEDSQAVIQYGVGAQTKISQFADTILTEVRNKDTGYVGETLADLVGRIKEVDVGGLSGNSSFFGKLFGGVAARIRKFIARYEKMSTQLDRVVDNLEQSRMTLLRDIALLDNLYDKNLQYMKDLDLYIAAGQLKIKQVKEEVLPALEAKAKESGDPADAQKLQDMNQMLNRFDKKVHDMLLSRMVAIQTAPQIRLIQNNDQTLVEKIQSSILNTIPLWKNQIVIAISLFRQKKALDVQKEVTDTTNELLSKNAEMLKDSSIEVAKESERGIVEIETLRKVNDDLISTIEETLQIQAEGRTKRRAAEQELVKMEGELKAKLTDIRAGA